MKKFALVLFLMGAVFCLFVQMSLKSGESMQLTSSAFKNGELLPKKYTCDGENVNPPLQWQNIPVGTKSFVLIMEDPDAPATKPEPWVHWLVFNIPASITSIDENMNVSKLKAQQGLTNSGKNEFQGACPPDKMHRYFFRLYALDIMLELPDGALKKEIMGAMKEHILATAQLMARYER